MFVQQHPDDLRLEDVIELLNCSERTVRSLVARSAIPFYRLGNSRILVFRRSELEAWRQAFGR
jgi:excisionase family DNA binding protein